MSFDNELEQDVSADSSPEVSQDQNNNSADSSAADTQQAAAPAKQEEQPFHMHPRFKELVEEKNSFRQRLEQQEKAFQAQLEALKAQLPKPAPAKDELMERLQDIDPAFAERFSKIGKVEELERKLAEYDQRVAQQAQQTEYQQVQSNKEKFFADKKIPSEHRDLYEAKLVMAAQANPNLKTSDLPKVMEEIHGQLSKLLTSVQREATKQLVAGKQAEAAKPSTQPKGVPASAAPGKDAPLSKAALQAEMRAAVLKDIRSSKAGSDF